jgi:hypothetical protein
MQASGYSGYKELADNCLYCTVQFGEDGVQFLERHYCFTSPCKQQFRTMDCDV